MLVHVARMADIKSILIQAKFKLGCLNRVEGEIKFIWSLSLLWLYWQWYICMHIHVSEVTQSCPTLCNPMDYSLPGSSVHGIFQARVLEWVAISFSRWSSQPRHWTWDSRIIDRRFTDVYTHTFVCSCMLVLATLWSIWLVYTQLLVYISHNAEHTLLLCPHS